MGDDWSRQEVERTVQDYLAMLMLETQGTIYNKTQHRQQLRQHLNDRSNGSVEFKHQNISAVLNDMGVPYIPGYKPRSNYQGLLAEVVEEAVLNQSELLTALSSEVNSEQPALSPVNLLDIYEQAPERLEEKSNTRKVAESAYTFKPKKIDFIKREAANRSLGNTGELLVLEYERLRLAQLGEERLAEKVEHISADQGDGAGFDILSFEPDGRERFIEVKTTRYGRQTPFFLSENENRFAGENRDRYFLYRLHSLKHQPKLFWLPGALQDHCDLHPTQYIARLL